MNLVRQKSRAGFTLAEMMVSVGCGSIILAAVMIASVAMQRSFAAVEDYSTAEGDQLRVLDYIAMDCRRALSASVTNNVLTLTVPNFYDSNGNPAAPTLDSSAGTIQYANATPVSISYYKSGSSFMRQIGSDPTKAIAIATNVTDFNVTLQSQAVTNGTASCTITFSPRFRSLPSAAAITGTTLYSSTFLRNAAAR